MVTLKVPETGQHLKMPQPIRWEVGDKRREPYVLVPPGEYPVSEVPNPCYPRLRAPWYVIEVGALKAGAARLAFLDLCEDAGSEVVFTPPDVRPSMLNIPNSEIWKTKKE